MKTNFVLERTGNTPLILKGTVISSAFPSEGLPDRYFDIDIFRTSNSYVLHISYFTTWRNESDRHDVYVCKSPEEVVANLLAHNWEEHVVGFPPGDKYEDRQKRLMDTLKRQYDTFVSDLLAEAGSDFAETLDETK